MIIKYVLISYLKAVGLKRKEWFEHMSTKDGMSIKILFCDNDRYILEVYRNLTLYVASKYQIQIEIEVYQNESQLIFCMDEQHVNTWDLLFINSNLKMSTGVELVKTLEQYGCSAEVVFISSDASNALDSFCVDPFYYFVRGRTTLGDFEKVLIQCLNLIKEKRKNMITVSSLTCKRRLYLEDIEYFKVIHRRVGIFCGGEQIGDFYGNLQQIEDKLQGKTFIRTYRSYIVNIKAINIIKAMELVTFSRTVIPIGGRYRQRLLNEVAQHGDINCMKLTRTLKTEQNVQNQLQKITNKRGFTIPTALAFTMLLLAMAASILLVAAYRFQKVYIRNQENQLYLYSTALVDSHSKGIEAGNFNELLARAVEKCRDTGDAKLKVYSKSYGFEMGLGSSGVETILQPYTKKEIGFVMIVTYEPQGSGRLLPEETADYIQIGDRMKVEYRIAQENIEYRITADYYCSQNTNVDNAGIPIEEPKKFINMKWDLNQYTGKFYNMRK